MAKNIIGIDISDASIEAIILDKKKGTFVVDSYSRYRLSPDIVEDGRVLQADKLKEAIKGLMANGQPKPFEDKRVFLSIPESRVFTRLISLPKNIRSKDLPEAARHRAEELIPESFDDLVPAMKSLPDSGDSKQILYAAAGLETINQFLSVFGDLGMEVVGLVPEAVSSFAGLSPNLEKVTTLMLDLGARTTIATIFDHNGIRDSININIAGNNLVNAVSEKLGLTSAQAEEKMKTFGLTPDGDGGTMLIIQGQLQPLVEELKKFISYYQETSGQNVEQIVLIGGLAQMKGINSYFGENLSLPAYIGEPFVAHEALPDFVDSTTFINVLGLAKISYQKPELNFLSDEFFKKKKNSQEEQFEDETVNSSELKEVSKKEVKKSSFLPKIKQVLGNKYFLILLLVLILFVLLLAFRDKIFPSGTNDANHLSNNNLSTNTKVNDKSSAIENPVTIPKTLSYDIVVGINPDGEQANFLLAEYFNLVVDRIVQESGSAYGDLVAAAKIKVDNEVLSDVNIKYKKDAYVIFPVIASSEILSASPAEADFVPGDAINMRLAYTLLAVPEDILYSILQPKLAENKISITDRQRLFDNVGYSYQGYDQNLQIYKINLELATDKL